MRRGCGYQKNEKSSACGAGDFILTSYLGSSSDCIAPALLPNLAPLFIIERIIRALGIGHSPKPNEELRIEAGQLSVRHEGNN
jgi:hypothetical protein